MREQGDKRISLVLWGVNLVLVLCLGSFVFMIYRTKADTAVAQTVPEKPLDTSMFDHLNLTAQSAIVVNLSNNRIIFQKDADTVRPLASLTKIMTAVTALSIMPQSATVNVTSQALATEGDSGLYDGESWSLKNLLGYSLTVSSNDGAEAVAAAAGAFKTASTSNSFDTNVSDFVTQMNSKASQLGLSSMHFENPTGLDQDDGSNGGVGSAVDVAHLLAYAFKNYGNILDDTKDSSAEFSSAEYRHAAINTDTDTMTVPGILAGKTGYTDNAGGNLAVIMDVGLGEPVAIVVLDSTYDGRFQDVQNLASSTVAYFQTNSNSYGF